MRLVYVGPIQEIMVPTTGTAYLLASRLVPVEIPDPLAARLLAQDTWQPAADQVADMPVAPEAPARIAAPDVS